MKFLLDVNTLIAWGWKDHPLHKRTAIWLRDVIASPECLIYTSAIPETGFVRVSVQRSEGAASVETSVENLKDMIKHLGKRHRFLPDDLSSRREFPAWCKSSKHTTDAHLLALAEKHGLQLATLDTGIPGAFVIPE
jgi:predicted nucleic acid-binding protein